MRKALIVGIDHYDYERIGNLNGAVNDATSVRDVLERNADGSVNFATPQLLTASDPGTAISRRRPTAWTMSRLATLAQASRRTTPVMTSTADRSGLSREPSC